MKIDLAAIHARMEAAKHKEGTLLLGQERLAAIIQSQEDVEVLLMAVARALDAAQTGQYDGAHHKTWTIDQVVRCLLGSEEGEETPEYEEWVKTYCDGEDGPETYAWDTGIAP